MNATQLIAIFASVLASAAPLIFASIGETLSERAGVVNLSLDGTMLLGAMVSFVAGYHSGSVVVGLLAGARKVDAARVFGVHCRLVSARANAGAATRR